MTQKLVKNLRKSLGKRTLSAYHMAVSIEIASRRDAAETRSDRLILKELQTVFKGLDYSWKTLHSDDNVDDFFFEWSEKYESLNLLQKITINKNISKSDKDFNTDILNALTVENLISKAEKKILKKSFKNILVSL